MIEVQNLSKTFPGPKDTEEYAVRKVSFEVRAGEVFGLLGPNGAGKTTTLRMLATLLEPSSGKATMNGFDVETQPQQVREQIGFLSGDMGVSARLTPRDTLEFYGKLAGMDAARRKARIEELLDALDMESFATRPGDKLSTGMKQKTAIARALLHNPPILILDEPTSGLDLPTAQAIEAIIQKQRDRGKCILYSTHVMEEAEFLCDRIGVIDGGWLAITGTMEQLRAVTGKQRLREVFMELLALAAQKAGEGK